MSLSFYEKVDGTSHLAQLPFWEMTLNSLRMSILLISKMSKRWTVGSTEREHGKGGNSGSGMANVSPRGQCSRPQLHGKAAWNLGMHEFTAGDRSYMKHVP